MLDEMAIRKAIEWNGSLFTGYTDLGLGSQDDSSMLATEVLVFMVVAVNASWKLPIAYFLINGLSGFQKAELVRTALMKLHSCGVHIISVTCDGPTAHLSMIRDLGAEISAEVIRASFHHPSSAAQDVAVFLDPCHMIKLLRNCLGTLGVIRNENGESIRWQYILELHKLQEQEGLQLANKLKKAHVQWKQSVMKVCLAVQTISASVADAIETCNVDLKLPQFKGSEATVDFLRIFDELFDRLNSRNPLGKFKKAPISPRNYGEWRTFFEVASTYIRGLVDSNGQSLLHSRRSTPFLGFLLNMKAVITLYHAEVETGYLRYLLMYKVSQDHLELFFYMIRSGLGANNNPSAHEFERRYKQLLIHMQVREGREGNCIPQDSTTILHCSSWRHHISDLDTSDMIHFRLCDNEESMSVEVACDEIVVPDYFAITECKKTAVAHIAGYVVHMAEKRLFCQICKTSLRATSGENLQLITCKSRGGLNIPSPAVIKVCLVTENILLSFIREGDGHLRGHLVMQKIYENVLLHIALAG